MPKTSPVLSNGNWKLRRDRQICAKHLLEITFWRRLLKDFNRSDLYAPNAEDFRRATDLGQETGYLGWRSFNGDRHCDLVKEIVLLARRRNVSLIQRKHGFL